MIIKYLLLLVVALGGCTTIDKATTPVDTTAISKAAYAARATYAGALIAAAQVTALKRCEVAPAPCVPQKVVNTIREVELTADKATKSAEDAVRNLGARAMPISILIELVDIATKSSDGFAALTARYKGGT